MEKRTKLVKVETNKKQMENIQPHGIGIRVNMADFNVRAPKAKGYNKFAGPQLIRKMTVQDIISLIKEVESHRVLWDKSSKEYSNKKMKNFTWENIALTLGFSSDQIKEKWKCLKQMFAKESDKFTEYSMNFEGPKPTKWPYMDSMSFLREITNRNESESDKEQNGDDDTTKSSKHKTKNLQLISSVNQQFYADEDYHFLLSLLQPLKRIPVVKKTSFKLKMLQLLCEEEYFSSNQPCGNFNQQYAPYVNNGYQED